MAGTRVYASMLPCIKCSGCGEEVDISMMGDHICVSPSVTQKNQDDHTAIPSGPRLNPPRRPSSPGLYSVKKPSPLATPPLRPDSPEDVAQRDAAELATNNAIPQEAAPSRIALHPSKSTTNLRLQIAPIVPENAHNLKFEFPPPVPNALNTNSALAPSPTQDEAKPPLPITQPTSAPVRPPRPPSLELMSSHNNPFSFPAESTQPISGMNSGHTSPGSPKSKSSSRPPWEPVPVAPLPAPKSNPTSQRPIFPSLHSNDEQDSAFLRKLSIPETSRPSFETAKSANPILSHSHKPSFPGTLTLPEPNKGEVSQLLRSRSRSKSLRKSSSEKVGLGLFRRKSSKSFSKKDISAPGFQTSEPVPALPNLPFSATQGVSATPNAKLDRDGRPLPSGPAPPRPARPDADDTVIADLQRSHSALSKRDECNSDVQRSHSYQSRRNETSGEPQRSQSSQSWRDDATPNLQRSHSTGTKLDEVAQKSSNTHIEYADEEKTELPSNRQSNASIYTLPGGQEPVERNPSQGNVGLPGISEVSDRATDLARDKRPPLSIWPHRGLKNGMRTQQDHPHPPILTLATSTDVMNGPVDHSSAESVSSNGSRVGFDERTDSSVSSPPTSTASSFSHTKLLLHEDPTKHGNAEPCESNHRPTLSARRTTANFSRPRIVESPNMALKDNQSEPTLPNLESPIEPPRPAEAIPNPASPLQCLSANLLPDPDQAPVVEASPPLPFEEQLRPRSNPYRQKFDRPPMPPMPEEPLPMPRVLRMPNLQSTLPDHGLLRDDGRTLLRTALSHA
ncbi:MAG: hypothetical protein M1831_002295 [Alyxoria varia]|nr:MAG: hypothetical protein M1831_002295 [Alyxoria varia]